jgi:hypothetical protein
VLKIGGITPEAEHLPVPPVLDSAPVSPR